MATDLSCYRGDTAEWSILVTRDSAPVDLDGGSVTMTVKRSDAATTNLFQLTSDPAAGITLGASTGTASIKLRTTDTVDLENEELDLVYYIHVETGAGDQWLVAKGTLTVYPSGASA